MQDHSRMLSVEQAAELLQPLAGYGAVAFVLSHALTSSHAPVS